MRIVILKLRALINGISPHNFDNTNHLFVLPGGRTLMHPTPCDLPHDIGKLLPFYCAARVRGPSTMIFTVISRLCVPQNYSL